MLEIILCIPRIAVPSRRLHQTRQSCSSYLQVRERFVHAERNICVITSHVSLELGAERVSARIPFQQKNTFQQQHFSTSKLCIRNTSKTQAHETARRKTLEKVKQEQDCKSMSCRRCIDLPRFVCRCRHPRRRVFRWWQHRILP